MEQMHLASDQMSGLVVDLFLQSLGFHYAHFEQLHFVFQKLDLQTNNAFVPRIMSPKVCFEFSNNHKVMSYFFIWQHSRFDRPSF